jgi:adenine-specific DNA-methyltransferase
VMDDVFGDENFVAVITFTKTGGASSVLLPPVADFILWYAKDKTLVKYRQLFIPKEIGGEGASGYILIENPDDSQWRTMTSEEQNNPLLVPNGWRVFDGTPLMSAGVTEEGSRPFIFQGKEYRPPANSHWKTSVEGLNTS